MLNRKIISVTILGVIVIGLWVNSTFWFRQKLANLYEQRQDFEKSIKLYHKILTKLKVAKKASEADKSFVALQLGHLYSKLGLRNKAVIYYSKVNKGLYKSTRGDQIKIGFNEELLSAIGFLEGGMWEKALQKFKSISRKYPYYKQTKHFIFAANFIKKKLIDKNITVGSDEFYLLIGDTYIQYKLKNAAKQFFTKRILDYGVNPLRVLSHLNVTYSNNQNTRQMVWGDHFYVMLEDFEEAEPVLKNYFVNIRTRVNKHSITEKYAFEGARSEFLDLSYKKSGNNYWAKPVYLSLSDINLKLGIRLYIKSEQLFRGVIRINNQYPKQDTSIASITGVTYDSDRPEWQIIEIKDLLNKTEKIGLKNKWDVSEIIVDKVIIDTLGHSTAFYVDAIELYLMN